MVSSVLVMPDAIVANCPLAPNRLSTVKSGAVSEPGRIDTVGGPSSFGLFGSCPAAARPDHRINTLSSLDAHAISDSQATPEIGSTGAGTVGTGSICPKSTGTGVLEGEQAQRSIAPITITEVFNRK